MSLTHQWTNVVKPSGLSSFPADAAITITSSEGVDVESVINAGSTATVFIGSIDNTKILSVAAVSSATTVSFTTAGPGQTITLSTGKTLGWHNQMPATNTIPFTVTLTKIVVDNTANASVATTFRFAALINAS